MDKKMSTFENEKERILKEYYRRKIEIPGDRYAIWNPSALHTKHSKERCAIEMLHKYGAFPSADTPCLEVGYGSLGWLGTLISWGVREELLHGIELDHQRAAVAKSILPLAKLEIGDASNMPFSAEQFELVIVSTVLTSVLEQDMRKSIAAEIVRVLKKGGSLIYYDFAFNNPQNPNVKGIRKKELLSLFKGLKGEVRKSTLAPPISRLVAPRSLILASFLESMSFLRTHLMAVLKKS
jgi:SAM-dependent methyltransferase